MLILCTQPLNTHTPVRLIDSLLLSVKCEDYANSQHSDLASFSSFWFLIGQLSVTSNGMWMCACVCVCLGVNDFDLTAAHQARWSKGTSVNHTPDTVRATHTHTHDSQFFSAQYECVRVPANMTQRTQNKTIWKGPGSGHPWVCCLSKLSNPSIRLVNVDVNPALFNTSSLWMALWFTAVTVVVWVFPKIKHPAGYSNAIRKHDLANLGKWQRQFSLLKMEELKRVGWILFYSMCTYYITHLICTHIKMYELDNSVLQVRSN